MQQFQLNPDELKATLDRAREISRHEVGSGGDPQLDSYIQAAEEMGVSRDAFLQALRERAVLPLKSFEVGELVFAPSEDEYWHVAEVVEFQGPTAVVRFLQGSDHTCARIDLRPLGLIPGRKVEAHWPVWGWSTGKVVSYAAAKGKVRLDDDLTITEFKLKDVRLNQRQANPPVAPVEDRTRRALWVAAGWGMVAGVLIDRFVLPWVFGLFGR